MNKTITTLAIVAVLAAAALVASTMVTDQAFARHRHHHSGGSCNGGSTCTSQTNIGRASASGDGSVAANVQLNLSDVSF
jgi:hypothetical protein